MFGGGGWGVTAKVLTMGGEKILGSFGRTSVYSTFNDMPTIGVFPKIPSTICLTMV